MRALKTEIISESDDMMVFFEMYEPVSDIKDGTPSWLLWEQYQTQMMEMFNLVIQEDLMFGY